MAKELELRPGPLTALSAVDKIFHRVDTLVERTQTFIWGNGKPFVLTDNEYYSAAYKTGRDAYSWLLRQRVNHLLGKGARSGFQVYWPEQEIPAKKYLETSCPLEDGSGTRIRSRVSIAEIREQYASSHK